MRAACDRERLPFDSMKAVLQDRYGSLDAAVRLGEGDRPTATGEQGLVRRPAHVGQQVPAPVRATSVNRADLDSLGPRPGFARLFAGLRRPRNPRMGIDVAGV